MKGNASAPQAAPSPPATSETPNVDKQARVIEKLHRFFAASEGRGAVAG